MSMLMRKGTRVIRKRPGQTVRRKPPASPSPAKAMTVVSTHPGRAYPASPQTRTTVVRPSTKRARRASSSTTSSVSGAGPPVGPPVAPPALPGESNGPSLPVGQGTPAVGGTPTSPNQTPLPGQQRPSLFEAYARLKVGRFCVHVLEQYYDDVMPGPLSVSYSK